MTLITIDAAELHVAAPRVTELHLRLVDSAASVAGLNVNVEMPPGVAGRVVGLVDAARADILAAAKVIEGKGEDIAERAGLAKLADRLGKISNATIPLDWSLRAGAYHHGREADWASHRGDAASSDRNRAYEERFKKSVGRLGLAGLLTTSGSATVADVRNPYISTDRKLGSITTRAGTAWALGRTTSAVSKAAATEVAARAATRAAERATTRTAAQAAARAVLGRAAFAIGGPAGPAVGLAWMLLDRKFHLSDRVVDGLTWAVGAERDAARWLYDHALHPAQRLRMLSDGAQLLDDRVLAPAGAAISDGVDEAGDLADKTTPWDGVLPG